LTEIVGSWFPCKCRRGQRGRRSLLCVGGGAAGAKSPSPKTKARTPYRISVDRSPHGCRPRRPRDRRRGDVEASGSGNRRQSSGVVVWAIRGVGGVGPDFVVGDRQLREVPTWYRRDGDGPVNGPSIAIRSGALLPADGRPWSRGDGTIWRNCLPADTAAGRYQRGVWCERSSGPYRRPFISFYPPREWYLKAGVVGVIAAAARANRRDKEHRHHPHSG